MPTSGRRRLTGKKSQRGNPHRPTTRLRKKTTLAEIELMSRSKKRKSNEIPVYRPTHRVNGKSSLRRDVMTPNPKIAIIGRNSEESHGSLEPLFEFLHKKTGIQPNKDVIFVDYGITKKMKNTLRVNFNDNHFVYNLHDVGFVVFDWSVWKFVRNVKYLLRGLTSLQSPGIVLVDGPVELCPCKPRNTFVTESTSEYVIVKNSPDMKIKVDFDKTTVHELYDRIANELVGNKYDECYMGIRGFGQEITPTDDRSLRECGIPNKTAFELIQRMPMHPAVLCEFREEIRKSWNSKLIKGEYPLYNEQRKDKKDFTILTPHDQTNTGKISRQKMTLIKHRKTSGSGRTVC